MKELILCNTGNKTFIDDEVLEIALSHSKFWYEDTGYACCKSSILNKTIRLHQLVLNAFDNYINELDTDHIDRNKLNNLKSNLRHVTRSQNMMNVPKKSGKTSKYKGVYFDKQCNKWRVIVRSNYRSFSGGLFLNEDEAALKANELLKIHHKEFAILNQVINQQTQQVIQQP